MSSGTQSFNRSGAGLTAAITLLTGILAFAFFLAASRAVLPGDLAIYRERVAHAFATGKLVEEGECRLTWLAKLS